MEAAAGATTKNDIEMTTTNGIMSLVVECSDLVETAQRLMIIVAALALAHGISTEV